MGNRSRSIEEEKAKLLVEINARLELTGLFEADTCPAGGAFGWDMFKHYALEWFERHPPAGWHIQRRYRHECYEWAITKE